MLENYVTSPEVMKTLRISASALGALRKSGRIEYIKVSDRKYLYNIDKFLNENWVNKEEV